MSETVIVGCGRIGMPLALAFASRGVRVLGTDSDNARLAELSRGAVDPDDNGLRGDLRRALAERLIEFGPLTPSAGSRTFIITVPTPVDDARRFVREPLDRALTEVTAMATEGDLVVIRSTVPIGTTRAAALAAAKRLRWAACPDRSTTGRALTDQFEIPHVVGGLDELSASGAEQLFGALGRTRRVSSPETAEALKLFDNVHRDMSFALANQFALVCEAAGIDFSEVRSSGADGFPRFDLPRPGPVGGPCLSKDVYLLEHAARDGNVTCDLLLKGRLLNEGLVARYAAIVRTDLDIFGDGPVAILGLAFKGVPPVTDQRESFGVQLKSALHEAGIVVRSWDPVSDPLEARRSAIEGARVVVLANDHPGLADLSDLGRFAPGCVVYDLCGTADPATRNGTLLRVFGDGRTRK